MRVFVTGTDTDVGKTTICSWLCLHTNYAYFKPIQTGNRIDVDKETVKRLSDIEIYEEAYSFMSPVSPHLAAKLDNSRIDLNTIKLPVASNLIVEGAGGLLVPLNNQVFMIDLIKMFEIPTILVARSSLGTINHTLLSVEALRKRNINILGIIMNGEYNESNKKAIEFYAKVKVLASFPQVPQVTTESLLNIKFNSELKSLFKIR